MGQRAFAETEMAILHAFIAQREWSLGELAERVDLSPDALRKRLKRLKEVVGELSKRRAGAEVVWSVPPGWRFEGAGLTAEQVLELLRLLQHAPRGVSRERMRRVLLARPGLPTVTETEIVVEKLRGADANHLECVRTAAAEGTVLEVNYVPSRTGEAARRKLSPVKILDDYAGSFLAWCHTRQDLRIFKAANIRGSILELPTTAYHRVEAAVLNGFLRERTVFGYVGSGPSEPCEFEVYPPDARWIEAQLRPNLPENLRLEPHGLESLRVTVTVPSDALSKVAALVLRLGGQAKAVSPSLRKLVLEGAKKLLSLHDDPPQEDSKQKKNDGA